MKGLRLVIRTDGASKGNPGRTGVGVSIVDGEGKRVGEISRYLGHKTNNEAEYWALLLGLREAKRLGADSVHVYTDSELIERQVNGIYKVKDPKMKLLNHRVMEDMKGFSSFIIESVPREQNREADRLANQAIQKRINQEREKGG